MKCRIKVLNLQRRPDRLETFWRHNARALQGLEVEVVPAVDGRALRLTPALQHLFAANDFAFRRGVMGCALSHIQQWIEADLAGRDPAGTAARGVPSLTLVLEDDVQLCDNFSALLPGVVLGLTLRLVSPDPRQHWDSCFLGTLRWDVNDRDRFTVAGPVDMHRLHSPASIVGGTFGYFICPAGARRLLQEVAQRSVYTPIDWLMLNMMERAVVGRLAPELGKAEWQQPNGRAVDTDVQNDWGARADEALLDAQARHGLGLHAGQHLVFDEQWFPFQGLTPARRAG